MRISTIPTIPRFSGSDGQNRIRPQVLNLQEAANLLDVPAQDIVDLIEQGKLEEGVAAIPVPGSARYLFTLGTVQDVILPALIDLPGATEALYGDSQD